MSNHQIDQSDFDDIDDYIDDLEENTENYVSMNDDDIDDLDEIEESNPNSTCVSQLDNSNDTNEVIHETTTAIVTPSVVAGNDKVWDRRGGNAVNEDDYEYDLFKHYLNLGGGRSKSYISTLFRISTNKVESIYRKNNWRYRSMLYDAECLALAHEDIDRQSMMDHQKKLENYRTQQEIIANQASITASKILSINLRKINEILENNETPTIQEVTFLGSLANKLAVLGKDLGAQALGVDALLEALEDSSDSN